MNYEGDIDTSYLQGRIDYLEGLVEELRNDLRYAEREIQAAYREGKDDGYHQGRDSCSDNY